MKSSKKFLKEVTEKLENAGFGCDDIVDEGDYHRARCQKYGEFDLINYIDEGGTMYTTLSSDAHRDKDPNFTCESKRTCCFSFHDVNVSTKYRSKRNAYNETVKPESDDIEIKLRTKKLDKKKKSECGFEFLLQDKDNEHNFL